MIAVTQEKFNRLTTSQSTLMTRCENSPDILVLDGPSLSGMRRMHTPGSKDLRCFAGHDQIFRFHGVLVAGLGD